MLSLKYIVIPFMAAIISQSIKTLLEFIKYRKFSFQRFINGMGGMPSTHSALVSSLTSIIYLYYGVSPLFAVTLFFSLIVIYDAMGIRYESGKQAKYINMFMGSNLEEHIGHKPLEVLVGVFIGILITLILNRMIK